MSFTSQHLFFDDVEVGQNWLSLGRTITEADIVNFAGLSGDFNPIHIAPCCATPPPSRGPSAQGLRVFSGGSGRGVSIPPMRTLAVLSISEWHFRGPVFIGDTVRVRSEVVQKDARARGRRGVVTW